MVEGGSSKDFRFTKQMMYAQPEVLLRCCLDLIDAVIDHLNAQIDAGACRTNFDSWGGALATPWIFRIFFKYMQKIAAGLTRKWRMQSACDFIHQRWRSVARADGGNRADALV